MQAANLELELLVEEGPQEMEAAVELEAAVEGAGVVPPKEEWERMLLETHRRIHLGHKNHLEVEDVGVQVGEGGEMAAEVGAGVVVIAKEVQGWVRVPKFNDTCLKGGGYIQILGWLSESVKSCMVSWAQPQGEEDEYESK